MNMRILPMESNTRVTTESVWIEFKEKNLVGNTVHHDYTDFIILLINSYKWSNSLTDFLNVSLPAINHFTIKIILTFFTNLIFKENFKKLSQQF